MSVMRHICVQVLLVPGRIFIREGTMWKVCRKGLKRRQFFLFNDVLVSVLCLHIPSHTPPHTPSHTSTHLHTLLHTLPTPPHTPPHTSTHSPHTSHPQVYGSIVASRYNHQQVLPLSQMSVSSECHYQSTVQATFDLDREQLDEQLGEEVTHTLAKHIQTDHRLLPSFRCGQCISDQPCQQVFPRYCPLSCRQS